MAFKLILTRRGVQFEDFGLETEDFGIASCPNVLYIFGYLLAFCSLWSTVSKITQVFGYKE